MARVVRVLEGARPPGLPSATWARRMRSMNDSSMGRLAWIRREASRICGESGRPIPSRLLHEGLPVPLAESCDEGTEAIDLDSLAAAWIARHPSRRSAGIYLTPSEVARALLDRTTPFHPRSILDPAVGAGVFLVQARKVFGAGVALHGADIDPVAVLLTRAALWLAGEDEESIAGRILHADSTATDWRAVRPGGFDLVCGNPPFGNAIEARTGRSGGESQRLQDRFPGLLRGPFDRCVPFVLLGAESLTPAGRYAWILPRALLSARYATRLREWLDRHAPLERLVSLEETDLIPDVGLPMAGWIGAAADGLQDVAVVDLAGRALRAVPRSRLRLSSWGALLDPLGGLADPSRPLPRLGDSFEIRASMTVAEAYEAATDLQDGDAQGWRLLTAGSLTRYGDLWGRRRSRVLGRDLLRPILPRETGAILPTRKRHFDSPKVIVAGLSRVFKARLDSEGAYAGSVGTLMILPNDRSARSCARLRAAAILLNSAWLTELHRARAGPAGLAGGGLNLLKRDLEELPFLEPAALEELLEITPEEPRSGTPQDDRLQRSILGLAGFDAASAEAILASWRSKLPRAR